MKFIAGIMALIVLFLTVQPAFAVSFKSERNECSSHCCNDKPELPSSKDTPGEPCSDFCNPLLKCGTCAATTIEFLNFNLAEPVICSSLNSPSTNSFYFHFSTDFWQPPRLG